MKKYLVNKKCSLIGGTEYRSRNMMNLARRLNGKKSAVIEVTPGCWYLVYNVMRDGSLSSTSIYMREIN